MRYLTPVGIREKFVASGIHTCYVAQPDSETQSPSGVVEYWTIHELPDKTRLIRGDRQAQPKSDSDMQVLATLAQSASGRAERMDMRVYVGPDLAAEARYLFFDDHVEISRQTKVSPEAYGEREHTEMALPAGYRVDFGRITISRGFIVRAALATQRQIAVFSPHNPGGHELRSQPERILKGSLVYYSAEPDEWTTCEIGKTTLTGQKCRIDIHWPDGNGYGYTGIVDKQGLMLEDGTRYIYRLSQIAIRPQGL